MISAQEVRDMMAANRGQDDLDRLEKIIKAAADKGKRSIRVPYDMFDTFNYSAKFKSPLVEETLQHLGYQTEVKIEELQFVDVWIEVSW